MQPFSQVLCSKPSAAISVHNGQARAPLGRHRPARARRASVQRRGIGNDSFRRALVQAAIAACTRALRNESLQAVDMEAEGGESDTVCGEKEQALRETYLQSPCASSFLLLAQGLCQVGFSRQTRRRQREERQSSTRAARKSRLSERPIWRSPCASSFFVASTRAVATGSFQADEKKTEGGEAGQREGGSKVKAS